jgi:membrane protein DedA with SNARE-associated domain
MQELVELTARYGVLFVFANVFIEQIGLPVPAMPTLVLAGALAADGKLSAPLALLAALVAATIGDTAWYLVGRRFGPGVLRTVCRVSLSPDSCVRSTENVFEKYGLASLLLAKFIPGYSTLAPPLAGVVGIGAPTFLAYNAAGTILWSGLPLVAGMLLHGMVDQVLAVLEGLGTWGVVLLAGGLAFYMLGRWVRLSRIRKSLRIARISPAELQRMMDAGISPLILDVRTNLAVSLDPRTLPGAVHVPVDRLDAALTGIPFEREIALFCT